MAQYCIKKFFQMAIVMMMISFLSFGVIYLAPGDVSSLYIRPDMTMEEKQEIRERLGVDRSMPEQYFSWAARAIRGDFGISYVNEKPVLTQFLNRLPATLLLMGSSLILSVVLAIILGLAAGYKRNSKLDSLISGISYIGMSIPSFWLGMILILVFAANLNIFPIGGMHTIGTNTLPDTLHHMVLPCITLCMGNLAGFIRYIRSNTIREFKEEYILTARAKGTPGKKILWRHVAKNTLLPVITLVGMNLSSIVCGSFVIETVFGWPGIGTYVMTSINARDYPVIMFYILLSGAILLAGNFVADILYGFVDPRIKRRGK